MRKKAIAVAAFGVSILAAQNSITVTTPNLSLPQSNGMTITVTMNRVLDTSSGAANFFYYIVDGGDPQMPAGTDPPSRYDYITPATILSDTCTLDTTALANGPHVLYIDVKSYSSTNGYTQGGIYGPVAFTTNNGRIPWQLRANYKELWLTPNQSVQITAKLVYSDKSSVAVPAASAQFSVAASAVAMVDGTGNVTGLAEGDTLLTITASGFASTVRVHVNSQNNTPHFGRDGSLLSSYEATKSLFVRSMFFLGYNDINSSQQVVTDLQNAQVNTFEGGLYLSPVSEPNFAQWQADITQTVFQPAAAAIAASGMNALFTGDEIARGDARMYESTRGASTAWSPNPIVYTLNWAQSLGHTIGIEMVDEVSYMYGYNPYPQGGLGQAGGPQQIACVNNNCTVTWPGWEVNGGNRFLVTGAVSNPNLNRNINNYYTLNGVNSSTFTFTASGVGTGTFTAATDPALVLQVYAFGPQGANGLDYVHNDAVSVLMNTIHSAGQSRPMLTWPVAGDMSNAVQPWQGDPNTSDFGTMYYSFLSTSYPWGPTLREAQYTEDTNFDLKYPSFQRDRPILMETTNTGPQYFLVGTPVPVTTINGNTIQFSQPHNITDVVNAVPRFSLTGNSNSGLNTRFLVYAIVDATQVRAYLNQPVTVNSTWQMGGTATYPDGQAFSITGMQVSDANNANIDLMNAGTQLCPTQSEANGQVVTVTGSPYGPFNKQWFVTTNNCGLLNIKELPTGSGTGGTAEIIYNNNPPPINDGGRLSMVVAASVAYAAAKGFAGVRSYGYGENLNTDPGTNAIFAGDCTSVSCGIQPLANPRANGPDSAARWQAMGYANNLISQIEPYLLTPKLHSPDYGPSMVTAARSSAAGNLLMMINFTETQVTETIDLSAYNPNGMAGILYRMSSTSFTQSGTTGNSQQVTFAPGETLVWAFPANGRSSCDLNGDGSVTAVDIQLVVDQALGLAACSTGDVNGDGMCNVVDVQIVIDAALGLACKAGASPQSLPVGRLVRRR